MALTIPADATDTTTLEAFVDHVRREIDLRDLDSVATAGPELKKLANDRSLLANVLTRQAAAWRTGKLPGDYLGDSFLLAEGPGFRVRANFWPSESDLSRLGDPNPQFFAYGVAHDHAFSFLTVGYYGPGYETLMCEVDPDTIVGRPGEKVALGAVQTTWLTTGKVMLYRAKRDVHLQRIPPSFSVSLNLTINLPEHTLHEQLLFDLEAGTVLGPSAASATTGRILLCDLAAILGDSRTVVALERIAERHPTPSVRAAAWRAIAALDPSAAPEIWRRALADGHPLVRDAAEFELRSS